MDVFYFIVSLLVPLSMTGLGMIWRTHPPKEIDGLSGYRTAMSVKSQETWIFANKYAANIWFFAGLTLTAVTILAMLLLRHLSSVRLGNAVLVIVFIQLMVMLLTLLPTEIALHRRFDRDGRRK